MDIEINTDKSKLDIPLIHQFLSNTAYWSKGRTLDAVQSSIENSISIGVYLNKHQIGFARIVTDKTIFAWIMDVFILPDYRGNNYSKMLMQYIITLPELKGVRRWGLATADAHELYKQFGFTNLSNPENLMERIVANR